MNESELLPLQERVAPWMQACFGPEISADRLERGDRLLEEVLELLQSGDYPSGRVAAVTSYTYSRDKGEPHQEAGGVMITLAAYCLAHGLDMHRAGEDELARIWTKVDKIRAKQATKPTGSALPIALPQPTARVSDEAVEAAEAVLVKWGMTSGQRTAARLALEAAYLTPKPQDAEPIGYVTREAGMVVTNEQGERIKAALDAAPEPPAPLRRKALPVYLHPSGGE